MSISADTRINTPKVIKAIAGIQAQRITPEGVGATATTPKSSGVSKRTIITKTREEIALELISANADHFEAEIILDFNDIPEVFRETYARTKINVLPFPSLDFKVILPPCASIMVLATASPNPVP